MEPSERVEQSREADIVVRWVEQEREEKLARLHLYVD
jgi:hypothetical protein